MALDFLGAQLHAADLSGDRLRQLGDELDAPHPLVRRELLAGEREDRRGQFARGLRAGHQDQVGLRHGHAQRVGAGHHGDFGHRLVLDQRALQFERADAVVGSLEHVVGAADEGDVAVGITRRDIAGVVVAVVHRLGVLRGAFLVAGHQAERALAQVDADLAFVGLAAVCVEQRDAVAGQRPAHRARLERLAGRVADLRGGLGLAVAVAQLDAPGGAHALDDLGVERLAGADQLAQLQAPAVGREVFLDQHAPHRRRRAQAGDAVTFERRQQALRVEA